MVDPAIGSLLFTVVKGSYEVIKQASALNLIANKSAVIYWHESILEFQWHLKNYSKGKTSFFVKSKSVIINDIIEVNGQIFPHNNKDLFELGIISFKNNVLTIDLKKILLFKVTEIVIIIFKTAFNKTAFNNLCKPYLRKKYEFEYIFSVVLDKPELWLSDFSSLTYRNIFLENIHINIPTNIIEECLSEQLKDNVLKWWSDSAIQENQDALGRSRNFSNFLKAINEERKDEIESLINIESKAIFDPIVNINCLINEFELGNDSKIHLPSSFIIQINCSVEGKEHAIRGKILFDIERYKEFLINILNNYFI